MEPERRQRYLLAVLAVVALAGLAYWLWPAPAAPAPTASNVRGGRRAANAPGTITAPDVHLESLESERPKPGDADRNLFRFKPKAVPPPPPVATVQPPPEPVAVPSGPPPAPPVPPIPLKFIGVLEKPDAQKVAWLVDGRGRPVYGKEGETVLGQYKILRIGAESIEMAYLDGRGRQTIRMTGS
jgi:hypothetical protein